MPREQPPALEMVLVMGVTGAGKTYFINKLTGVNLAEGNTLKSCTTTCKAVSTNIGNTDVIVVDCPGFDDTKRSDTEILEEIMQVLSAQYILRVKLRGIVFLHRITDNRMQGSTMKNLQLFTKLVGESALSNVSLVTTMWGNVTENNEGEANSRDSELRDDFWGDMIRKGSSATRFDGTKESAQGILSLLLGKKDVVLKVQEELVDLKMPLNKTTVGAFLEPRIHSQHAEYETHLKELGQQLAVEKDSNRRLEFKQAQRRAEAGKEQRKRDKETLRSKPGEKVEETLGKSRWDSIDIWKSSLQALAAIVSITFAVISFVGC